MHRKPEKPEKNSLGKIEKKFADSSDQVVVECVLRKFLVKMAPMGALVAQCSAIGVSVAATLPCSAVRFGKATRDTSGTSSATHPLPSNLK